MMLTKAMAHQVACVEKLNRIKVGAIFMEMGTGKSRCFYELAERKISAGKASRHIVLCPVSAKDHLADEALKHTGHDAVVHCGRYTLSPKRHNIIGIESISTSIAAMNKLAELSADAVVTIDESTLIKNRNAARTRHIMQATQGARYRYISSGLPMPNGVEDLYSQMQWLSPLILGYRSYSEFSRLHLRHSGDVVGQYGQGRIVGRFNTDLIASKIAPYSFETRKSDCLDLPDKRYSYRTTDLDAITADAYAEAKRRILLGRDAFDVDDATIFRLFTALQQISAGSRPGWLFKEGEFEELRSTKAHLLKQVLLELNGKAVIWCKYLNEADAAEDVVLAAGKKYVRIDGSVASEARRELVSHFKRDTSILIATLSVGGRAHDWGFAETAIYMSNSFDYEHRAQSEDRIHRAGMTGGAHYIDLRASTGIEKRISRSLGRKENACKAFQEKIRQLRSNKNAQGIEKALEQL